MPVEAMMCVEFRQRQLRTSKFSPSPARSVGEGARRADEGSLFKLKSKSDLFSYKNLPRRSAGRQEEPSPGLRPPSPIAAQRARGKFAEVQPIVAIIPRTAPAA